MAKSAGRATDPLITFLFSVDVQGQITGYFQECSGIGSENEVVDHKVTMGKGYEYVQKIPGRVKYSDVTLKRGIADDMEIWDWRQMVVDGKMDKARKNCSITMYDRDYKPAAKWDLVNAWPSKVTGPAAKADSNEFGVEEMVLVHEGMKRVKP